MAIKSVPFPTGENQSLLGKRVRLIHTDDPYTRLKRGDEGTIVHVDSAGTVHIDWDEGSNLGLIPGLDKWEVL